MLSKFDGLANHGISSSAYANDDPTNMLKQ